MHNNQILVCGSTSHACDATIFQHCGRPQATDATVSLVQRR
jgi:hypothetical protein